MALLTRRGTPIRRRSFIPRDQFGDLQADIFASGASAQIRQVESEDFERTAAFEMDRLRAQQQYQKSEDPGIYNIPGVKGLWEGTGTALSGALDILGRPAQAVSGAVLAVQEGRPFWEGVGEGFWNQKEDLNFATVLENAGMEHELSRNVLGFVLDAVTDPLNIFMVAKVRTVTKALARGTTGPIAAIPIRSKTLGERADIVTAPARRRVARLFGGRLGAGAGPTLWELRRAYKGDSDALKLIGQWEQLDRNAKRFVQDQHNLVQTELWNGLHAQRKADLLNPRVAGYLAKTDEEAERLADEFIEELQTNDGARRGIGEVLVRLRETLSENTELGLVMGEEKTGKRSLESLRREALRYDLAAREAEEFGVRGYYQPRSKDIVDIETFMDPEQGGIPDFRRGSDDPSALMRDRVFLSPGNEAASLVGLGSLVRWMRGQYGATLRGDVVERGALSKLSETWFGMVPTEALYYPKFYPGVEQVSQYTKKFKGSGLPFPDHVRQETLKTADAAIGAGVELDFAAAFAHDIVARRSGALYAQILDLATLEGLGHRAPLLFSDLKTAHVQLNLRLGQGLRAHLAGLRAQGTAIPTHTEANPMETLSRLWQQKASSGPRAEVGEDAASFVDEYTPWNQSAIDEKRARAFTEDEVEALEHLRRPFTKEELDVLEAAEDVYFATAVAPVGDVPRATWAVSGTGRVTSIRAPRPGDLETLRKAKNIKRKRTIWGKKAESEAKAARVAEELGDKGYTVTKDAKKRKAKAQSKAERLADDEILQEAEKILAIRQLPSAERNLVLKAETLRAKRGRLRFAPALTSEQSDLLASADEIMSGVGRDKRFAPDRRWDGPSDEDIEIIEEALAVRRKEEKLASRARGLLKRKDAEPELMAIRRKALIDYFESTPRTSDGVFTRGRGHQFALTDGQLDEVLADAGEVIDEGVSSWVLPEPVAASLNKFNDPYEMGGFLRTVDAFNAMWKPTVTVFPLFISFFTRNAIGLVHNLLLSGMGPQAVIQNQLRAWKMIKSGLHTQRGRLRVELDDTGRRKELAKDLSAKEKRHVDPESITKEMLKDAPDHIDLDMGETIREIQLNGGINVGSRDLQPLAVGAPGREGVFSEVAAASRGEAVFAGTRSPGPAAGVETFRGGGRSGVGTTVRKAWSALRGEDVGRLTPMERGKAALANYNESMFERLGFNLFGWGTTFNQSMDNSARMTHILWRLSKGDTIPEASRSAAKFIGDYTELGEATSAIAAVIPFFRWTRFNVPLQVEGLLTRPYVGSKLAAATGDSANEESLLAEGTSLPEWVLDRHHIVFGKTPEGRIQILRGLGLPIEDLNKIFTRTPVETWRNVLSEATPILRAPIEWATNKSFWTGEAIDEKDDLYGFYKRGYAWATAPGISQTLGDWLGISQVTNPDTGRVDYRSDNPMGMFVFASFFGRFAQTGDKIWRGIENREEAGWLNAVNLTTGVKISEVYPDRPPSTTLNEAVNASPYLRNLYDQYQNMPLYPQFESVQKSRDASRANVDIAAFRRVMEGAMARKVTWSEAAARWGELSADNRQGELLARQVKLNKWKRTGRKARTAFLRQHPSLRAALETNLTDHERNIALDVDA